jgi:hypothetical protein
VAWKAIALINDGEQSSGESTVLKSNSDSDPKPIEHIMPTADIVAHCCGTGDSGRGGVCVRDVDEGNKGDDR